MLAKYTNYRWLVATILFAGFLGLNILWFIPSPLLPIIMEDLDLNLMQGGLGLSIVCLLVALFSFVGGSLLNKIGVKKCLTYGLLLMGLGALVTYTVDSFVGLFWSRVLIGIGFGLCMPLSGPLIMMWFPEKERPYMNTVNAVLPYIATAITFALTVPMYQALNASWRMTISIWGILILLVAIIWIFKGKERSIDGAAELNNDESSGSVWSVLKNREVILLSIAEVGDMWSFQFLSSMLPTFYVTEVGMDLAQASNITSIFPLAGIAAGLIFGIWMSRVGLRKPFTWPMHIMIFVGTFMAINGTGWIQILGVAMAGFGNAGWAPALFTMPMEFANMNPARVGAVYALMLGLGFLSAFVSPCLGGYLAETMTLHDVIFIFSFSSLVAALCTFLMRETGTRAGKQA